MQKPKVLVFLMSDTSQLHGGMLWTGNLLGNLARVPEIDFTIISSGPDDIRSANDAFVRAFGFDHAFVPFRPTPASSGVAGSRHAVTAARYWLNILLEKYYVLLERRAHRERHVDAAVTQIIAGKKPDLIVINDIWSALCVPSVFSGRIPCCLITLNNEVEFHRTFKLQSGPSGQRMSDRLERWIGRNGNWISNARMRQRVSWIFRRCAGIVALTAGDLPAGLPHHLAQAVLPPLFEASDAQWSHQGSRCAFFVGNVEYFPNRLAVEWICSRLAPELEKIDSGVRVNIIGASAEQVPSEWRRSNVNFMGLADRGAVTRHMITDDLFIAPIANNFGAKLKLAQCVSHGMPFLATREALSGLSFLTSMPLIDLDQPNAAARLMVESMNRPEGLIRLSRSAAAQTQAVRQTQSAAWRDILLRSMGTVVGHDAPETAVPKNTNVHAFAKRSVRKSAGFQ